jgi:hypothetical protein
MLFTITVSLSVLVVINLLLLKFSCNKIVKQKQDIKKAVVLNTSLTIEHESERLAPTGS